MNDDTIKAAVIEEGLRRYVVLSPVEIEAATAAVKRMRVVADPARWVAAKAVSKPGLYWSTCSMRGPTVVEIERRPYPGGVERLVVWRIAAEDEIPLDELSGEFFIGPLQTPEALT